jgi:hypothetical protein
MSTFPGKAPAPTEGQIDLNGDVLRKPTIHEQPYACCAEALVLPTKCVCFFVSNCAIHGYRHNGTHD